MSKTDKFKYAMKMNAMKAFVAYENIASDFNLYQTAQLLGIKYNIYKEMFLNTTYRDENNLNSNDTSLYTSPGATCMNEFIERMLYFSN